MGEGGLIRPAVVLVEPAEAGNAGAVARAMANFGLSELILAGETPLPEPRDFVTARLEGRAILNAAGRAPDLASALAPFHLAVAVTRRTGKHRPADLTPDALAGTLAALPEGSRAALVFGRETDGLRAEEALLCGRLLHIPTSPDAPSLNLAQAVAVTAYGWSTGVDRAVSAGEPPATIAEVEALYASLEESLAGIGFLEGDRGADTMASLRRLFGRAALTDREVRLLRGLARKIGDAASG